MESAYKSDGKQVSQDRFSAFPEPLSSFLEPKAQPITSTTQIGKSFPTAVASHWPKAALDLGPG